jgi:hypothetical protein
MRNLNLVKCSLAAEIFDDSEAMSQVDEAVAKEAWKSMIDWKYGAKEPGKAPYFGESIRSQFRKKKKTFELKSQDEEQRKKGVSY